ncbi:hypothetical protein M501DRAFT_976739 [Patellaria atrata CBS 101060]|uniref:Serine hydrolase domain-containing protein n=1 Tax=Patellaria atrata CBS 101060 TaxID=1346257 RepID=A0A9P4S979_9PEZI|nr:hypothetical protein M501DRAFT_976739 [Patellaria atrata CBS 101060]
MPSPPGTPLPRIACFHGSGSNSQVMNFQCTRLLLSLQADFELVFFDGPFPRPAGPGVLPVFEDMGPFNSWFNGTAATAERADGSGWDEAGTDGVERAFRLMLEEESAAAGEEGGRGEWVAALGFSQGSRVVAGMLLDQQRRAEQGVRERPIKFRFGVLCCGSGRPMRSAVTTQAGDLKDEIVHLPTLHLHGLQDPFLKNGRDQYAKYFEHDKAVLCEIDYHHAMPWKTPDVERFAKLLRQMYSDTTARQK